MEEARDEVYSHMIAQRAVARAALYLGVDSMTQEAVDTLSGILLSYLARIGKTLSVSVEASGRSSAHCNVLDAIRAVELCTAQAVQRVHAAPTTDEAETAQAAAGSAAGVLQQQQQSSQTDSTQQMTWNGLAAFCFGPNWHLSATAAAQQQLLLQQQELDKERTDGAGGKVGPSATAKDRPEQGWNAPYPDELPPFPTALPSVANPHPLQQTAKERKEDKTPLAEIPDSVFTETWGELEKEAADKAGKRKHASPAKDSTEEEQQQQPPAKKMKRNDGTSAAAAAVEPVLDSVARPDFVPRFYPPFPRPSDTVARTVVAVKGTTLSSGDVQAVAPESSSATATARLNDPATSVRSALVQLGKQQYWGSAWEKDADSKKNPLSVRAGPSVRVASTAGLKPQIAPLGRNSVSRISRILEGSMDPPKPE